MVTLNSKRIWEILQNKGLGADGVARLMGISPSQVRRVLGRGWVHHTWAELLAGTLCVDIEEITLEPQEQKTDRKRKRA